MRDTIICAGFGGQGILLLGDLIVKTNIKSGLHGTSVSSYGSEARGGTCNCQLTISEDDIGDPFVLVPDELIIMNKASLIKFEKMLKKDGILLYDSSLISQAPERDDIEIIAIPASKMASDLGQIKSANMVMFGAYIKKMGLDKEKAIEVMKGIFIKDKSKFLDSNIQAFEKGYEI